MMKKNKKKMRTKTKIWLLKATSFISLIAPISGVMIYNFDEYFTRVNSVRLSFGGMLGMFLILLQVKGETQILKGIWGYLMVFLLAVFLKPIINDIILLTGALLSGKFVNVLFIENKIVKLEETLSMEKQGEIQKEVNRELVEEITNIVRSGRV